MGKGGLWWQPAEEDTEEETSMKQASSRAVQPLTSRPLWLLPDFAIGTMYCLLAAPPLLLLRSLRLLHNRRLPDADLTGAVVIVTGANRGGDQNMSMILPSMPVLHVYLDTSGGALIAVCLCCCTPMVHS
jgi:hypothetical protein